MIFSGENERESGGTHENRWKCRGKRRAQSAWRKRIARGLSRRGRRIPRPPRLTESGCAVRPSPPPACWTSELRTTPYLSLSTHSLTTVACGVFSAFRLALSVLFLYSNTLGFSVDWASACIGLAGPLDYRGYFGQFLWSSPVNCYLSVKLAQA